MTFGVDSSVVHQDVQCFEHLEIAFAHNQVGEKEELWPPLSSWQMLRFNGRFPNLVRQSVKDDLYLIPQSGFKIEHAKQAFPKDQYSVHRLENSAHYVLLQGRKGGVEAVVISPVYVNHNALPADSGQKYERAISEESRPILSGTEV